MKIYKYKLEASKISQDYSVKIELPLAARILSARAIESDIYIWAIINPLENVMVQRKLYVFPTGVDFDLQMTFIDTCVMHDGSLIWHVFE